MDANFARNRLIAGILAGAAALPMPARAQSPGAAADQGSLDEVVVTARKRTEKLREVPVSVATVNAKQMSQRDIKDLKDLQVQIPNFTLAENPIGTAIGIRGIFSGVNQGFEQSVGTYIDGISYGRAQQARAPFLDVDRVEVLRGPQSILFGKNSIAGAMNITTAQPESEFGGYFETSYEPEFHEFEDTAAVTGPISDTLRFRIAGRYHQTDGFMQNATLDRSEAQRDDWQIRGTLAADLTDDLTVSFKAEAGRFNTLGREAEIVGEAPADLPGNNPASFLFNGLTYAQILTDTGASPVNNRIATVNAITGMQLMPMPVASLSTLNTVQDDIRSSNGDDSHNQSQTFVFHADWQTDLGTVTAISGYSRFKYDELCDCDFTGAPVFNTSLDEDYKQFSQELRLVSPKDETVDYIVGGFFQHSSDDYGDRTRISAASSLVPLVFNQSYAPAFQQGAAAWLAAHPGDQAGAISAGRAAGRAAGAVGLALADTSAARSASVDADQWSLFGQGTWHITDALRATAGVRINHDSKDGDRTMLIQGASGQALSGQQAQLAPLAYAYALGVSSENLTRLARSGIPAVSGAARNAIAKLGGLPAVGTLSETRPTPSLSLQYGVVPDVMVYGSWVMGAKSGGFDYRANNKGSAATTDQAFRFNDEKATTWELGTKTRFWNGRAEINGDVYYTSYKDLQVSIFDGLLGFNVGNAASATVKGLELDGRVALTPTLSAHASFAWTDFRFDDFPNGQCYSGQAPNGPAAVQGYCSYAGMTNQFVAKYSGTAGLDHVHDLTENLTLHSAVDLFFTSSYFADPTLDPSLVQGAYVKLDARVGLGHPDGDWEVAILAKNLTDVRPLTFATATPLAYSVFGAKSGFAYYGEGRTFVLQGKVRF